MSNPQLDVTTPLTPSDAVGAIILVEGEYLLQLRDNITGIFYPGHWGCFGGGADAGESEQAALVRELEEEIGIRTRPDSLRFFTRFTFDFGFAGLGVMGRGFYELQLSTEDAGRLRLAEGADMKRFSPEAILSGAIPLTPYDGFGLWLHINRRRLVRR